MAGCNYIEEKYLKKVLAHLSHTGKLSKRNMAYFAYGITTGFRINEILTLTRKDVILQDGTRAKSITVPKSKMKGKHKSRTKDLEPLAVEYLNAWLEQQEYTMNLNQGWQSVFCQNNGKQIHYDCMRKILKSAFIKAGLSATPRLYSTHSLRKTFASFCQKTAKAKGLDSLESLQYIGDELDHSDLRSTAKYVKPLDTKKIELDQEKKKNLNNAFK